MDTFLFLLIVIILVLAIGFFVFSRRRHSSDDPLATRLAEYGERELPASLEELELSIPWYERVWQSISRRSTSTFGGFTPEHQVEQERAGAEMGAGSSKADAAPPRQREQAAKPPAALDDGLPLLPQAPPPPPPAPIAPTAPGTLPPFLKPKPAPAAAPLPRQEEALDEFARRIDIVPEKSAPTAPPPPPQAQPAPAPTSLPRQEEAAEAADEYEVLDEFARGGQAMPEPEPAESEFSIGNNGGMGKGPTSGDIWSSDHDNASLDAPPPPVPPYPASIPGAIGIGALSDKKLEYEIQTTQEVEFSAYYPKEVVPEKWEKLHTYILRQSAAGTVEADANQQLGERKPEFRGVRVPATVDVPEGALVTATPHLDGFQFNPPSISLGFYKDWHRFDFELRAKSAPLNQSTNGVVTFTVEGIIIADIPLSIFVGQSVSTGDVRTRAAAKLYQAIFCSYSHRDTQIVSRAERAYKALGLDYLRDVISLKSGQEWDEELLNLISKADIFQLFWSSAAAESPYVRQEWEYAVKLNRDKFIRPVYWEEPQPPIPPELGHIHFAYQPDLDD